MKSQVQDRFRDFYHTWFCKLEEILHQLLQVSQMVASANDQHVDVQHLVNSVTSHIKQYYTVKWAEAREDVLPFFAPTWLTPLENACSWITGWKPSMVFRLLRSLASTTASFGMSDEQARKIEELRMRMRMEEEKVEREMERLQVAMADHKIVELVKLSSRVTAEGGGDGGGVAAKEVEVGLKGVLDGLERMMKGADCVRLKTLKGVLDVLTPLQGVEFLASVLAMQLRLRQWGKKEIDRHASCPPD
ncbi:protein DOG1-like 4 [Prosopis cineraria]|uniref:protein DOG1-like 4 n=1 Tax=Prosopis cineraria TaxID=364024 RepID=UPI00240FD1A8|nr:protein DOG1-like 4 [Prosopis cineraria]